MLSKAILTALTGSPVGAFKFKIVIYITETSTSNMVKSFHREYRRELAMKKLVLFGIMSALLAGCAVQKELVPTGGSKADGIVELSYEFGGFDVPKVDEEQGAKAAKQRCEKWGYKDAEKFGGRKQVCNLYGGIGGCAQYLVTIQYQCLDK